MRKPTICIGENKGADQLRSKQFSAFVFATRIVQYRLKESVLLDNSGRIVAMTLEHKVDGC